MTAVRPKSMAKLRQLAQTKTPSLPTMNSTSDSLNVAHELFDAALRLYFAGNAYFAALHLAAAAEELLGKLVRERDGTPWLEFLQNVMMEAWHKLVADDPTVVEHASLSPRIVADFMNHARNHVKHSILPATYDAQTEAQEMLIRALMNYRLLAEAGILLPEPTLMPRLEEELLEKIRRGGDAPSAPAA